MPSDTGRPERPSLHDAIMNIPVGVVNDLHDLEIQAYRRGHRDARHAAAELVAELDSAPALLKRVDMLETALRKWRAKHKGCVGENRRCELCRLTDAALTGKEPPHAE